MKQTAVEWFLNEFQKQVWFEENSELDLWIKDLIPKAKAMEKEHSINLIVKYIEDNLDSSTHGNIENVKEWFELNK